ncbi:protealysin inhibitor emfourin [Amycolatopsis sp.]|uniref:protealysin inhibitor emfourin n=1 Tax=Amycolatopsis sp. TaxID=37632 RepID=UPI002BC473BF|nr:protealysin inhibitor emfourin [Amycolatopsis sp.]HVV09470.1 protealysin inhibitor emfourin [Amycolatopsis sp.]
MVRGGGITGLVVTTVADSGSLAPGDAETMREKVRDAGLLDASPGAGEPRPDAQTYEITVESEGREHRAVVRDGELPPGTGALLSWLDSVPGREETISRPR